MANRKLRELKKQYQYSDGSRYKVSAQVAGEELERISAKYGHLKSSTIVDESRPEDAALHPVFEWDDWKAAEKYRVHQASTLVRRVNIVSADPEVPSHKAYYQTVVVDEPAAVYVEAERIVASPAMFAEAVARLERTLNQARRSVDELQDLSQQIGGEPEKLARISLAMKAIEAAGAAVAALH
jgi:hypothetical protein